MVGSIDPRCETLRGTHWPVKVAGVFGTRVAENHLGQRFKATASTGRTYGCKRSDQTLKNSCGTGAVHIWVPAFAGTTPGKAYFNACNSSYWACVQPAPAEASLCSGIAALRKASRSGSTTVLPSFLNSPARVFSEAAIASVAFEAACFSTS